MRVEVDVGQVHRPADAARGRHRTGHLGQEAAEDVLAAVAEGGDGGPARACQRPVVAQRAREAAVVEARPLRVVVRVEGRDRGEGAAFAHVRARRILVDDVDVDVESEPARAEGPRIAPAAVEAVEAGAIVAEALPGHLGGHARLEPAPLEGQGEVSAPAAVASQGEPRLARPIRRRAMDDVHDADERGRAVHDGRGAAQHLDVVEVLDAQGGERGVEGAAPRHVVHDEQERVEFLQAPELGHGARRPAVAAGRDIRARDPRQRRAQVVGVARPRFVAADHGDHRGDGLRLFVQALGRDLHVFGMRRRG